METFREFVENYRPQRAGVQADVMQNQAVWMANKAAKKYQRYASDKTTDHRAAPNTGTFIATQSYMIRVVEGINVPEGMFNRYHYPLLQIGTGIDWKISRKIKGEFRKELETYIKRVGVPDPSTSFETLDGHTLFIHEVSGTNWGGIGLVIQ